jgi:putative ATP-dependent endonuclease of the OLD family
MPVWRVCWGHPDHDAAVEATVAALTRLRPRLAALVDGDSDGLAYARALSAAAQRPTIIVRWPDDWSMENMVGWILEADSLRVIEALATTIEPAPASINALVTRLKSEDRNGGLKQDQIAYEVIADVIGSNEECRRRARGLLNGMCEVLLGGDSARFRKSPDDPTIRIFQRGWWSKRVFQ